jgi:mono/diheme cytochrome c family protein/cytochrome c553
LEVIVVLAASFLFFAAAQQASASNEGLRLFEERVRPILQNNCVECHNPSKSKGEFDLSTRESLLFEGEYGAWVIPGDPDASELLLLVDHEDKPFMPKDEPQLAAEDRAAIRRWIELGAPYSEPIAEQGGMQISEEDREHWSFAPLAADSGLSVDAHLSAALAERGLSLSEQAQPRPLLRRITLDLTGLPPTPSQMNEFLLAWEVDAEAAYRAAVERLLADPAYGERWGRHWLDAARYADSGGYEFDIERPEAWPYRDWVIDAFNQDLPYDEFLRLQLAGDELQPEVPAAHAATGFLTAGPRIGNQDTIQNRYDELDDMVGTMGASMLGVTLACARCHDHKFDPLPTRDYYAILGAFKNTRTTKHPLLAPAELDRYREQQRAYDQRLAAVREPITAWEASTKAAIVARRLGRLELTEEAAQLLLEDTDPELPLWKYTLRKPDDAWMNFDFDDEEWPEGAPGFGTAATPGARVGTEWKSESIWLRREFEHRWIHMSDYGLAIHHDEDVTVYLNGNLIYQAEGYTTDYQFVPLDPAALQLFRPLQKNVVAVHCKQSVGGQYVDVNFIDRATLGGDASLADHVFRSRWQSLRDTYGHVLEVTPEQLREEATEAEKAAGEALRDAEQKVRETRPAAPQTVLSIQDKGPAPEKNWLLRRGNPLDRGEELELAFLQVLGPANPEEAGFPVRPRVDGRSSGQRSALAAWITDVERGAGRLVARVEANRIWHHHFGRGIVATPGDFGRMADPPTHPALLEDLANRLIDSGWSRKALHREILYSQAYRQAGQWTPALEQIDGNNLLWSYRPPVRLEAEAIRDAILAASGTLNREMGGPGVRPWIHSDAIATGSTVKWPKDVVDGPATWRRTVYIFQRRSVLLPTLETFDLPNATQSCTRRNRTTTPTQALAMLNNPFIRDQAKHFAARLEAEVGRDNRRDQITRGFEIALGRPPVDMEMQASLSFLTDETLADFCQVLFNLNEFLYLP